MGTKKSGGSFFELVFGTLLGVSLIYMLGFFGSQDLYWPKHLWEVVQKVAGNDSATSNIPLAGDRADPDRYPPLGDEQDYQEPKVVTTPAGLDAPRVLPGEPQGDGNERENPSEAPKGSELFSRERLKRYAQETYEREHPSEDPQDNEWFSPERLRKSYQEGKERSEPKVREPIVRIPWECGWSPTMNDNWHDDVLCVRPGEAVRPILLPDDDFITEEEMYYAAMDFQEYLNS